MKPIYLIAIALIALCRQTMAMDTYKKELCSIRESFDKGELTLQTIIDFYEGHGTPADKLQLLEPAVNRMKRTVFETAKQVIVTKNTSIKRVENAQAGLYFVGTGAKLLFYEDNTKEEFKRIQQLANDHIGTLRQLMLIDPHRLKSRRFLLRRAAQRQSLHRLF